MRTKFLMTGLAATLCAFLPHVVTAVTINSPTITMSLAVTGPTCTVNNSNASIPLPPAQIGETVASYQTRNLPIAAAIAAQGNPSGIFTSTALNQTAIINCSAANTPILSFLIKPGAGANSGGSTGVSYQFLADSTTPTPLIAAGGPNYYGLMLNPELISINGSPTVAAFGAPGTLAQMPYTGGFSTGALNTGSPPSSTATAVWRPYFEVGTNNQNTFKAGVGTFNGSYQIVVDY